MKANLWLFLIFLAPAGMLHAQEHLSVDLSDPSYILLEMAEIRGAVDSFSKVKPYTASVISGLLSSAKAGREGLFSPAESEVLAATLRNLADRFPKQAPVPDSAYPGTISFGFWAESLFKLDAGNPEALHMWNALRFFLRGDIGNFLSFDGNVGFTFDRVGPESYEPYTFTREWDGFHIGFGELRYSLDGNERVPYMSIILENDISAEFFGGNLGLSFSRHRRDWGIGDGSLLLSGTARPFEGLDVRARFAPWIGLSYTVGSLGNWARENQLDPDVPDGLSFQKMFTAQVLEFFPLPWFSFSVASSAVWGKRFELGYLNPLMFPLLHQNLQGDMDNVMLELRAAALVPGYAKFYFSFFVDEMENVSREEILKRPRNMTAFQAGVKDVVPWLPFVMVTLQYTKIEPFVYAHYPEDRISSSKFDVDMSYTHDGENLGYALPPNSDEILVKVESVPVENLTASLSYRLIRHGTNDPGDPQAIFGDVTHPFDYTLVDLYPDRKFLEDGYYDWNNVITLAGSWRIPGAPVLLSVSYSFCHTFWDMNSTGLPRIQPQFKNIFSIRVRLF